MRFVLACAIWLAFSLPAPAHHSGAAEFDSTKKIDLTGVVTNVEWTNPHAHFYMDVKDASGKVVNWNLELASPNVLIRNGWKRNSVKPGDTVSVTGVQAKDSSNYASAGVITFPDGHKLTFLAGEEPAK
jgi:Family of unknown function (DUF6152)